MIWIWLALQVQPSLACAGSSDELRNGLKGIVVAVLSGRCEVVI